MTIEVELKFFANRDLAGELNQLLSAFPQMKQVDTQLGNLYFDTRDQALRDRRFGLRIRSQDGQREQTIKGGGRTVGGLHQRTEVNLPIQADWPDLWAFPADIWPEGTDLNAWQQALQPQFRTDFRRRAWQLILADGSQVEVAFDVGQITASGSSEPICEVELELLSGQTASLFGLAEQILQLEGLRLGNVSKAQRGYRLAGLAPEPEVERMGYVPVHVEMTLGQGLQAVLSYALNHWQYHEQLFVEQPSLAALTQLRNGVALIQQTQVLFADLLVQLAPRPWQAELSWLEHELAWLDEAQALTRLTDEHGRYLRELECHDAVLQALQQRQLALPTLARLQQICQSSRYARLLLSLSRWLYQVQSGPEPELATSALLTFANRELSVSWQELHEGDMGRPCVDYATHLALVGKLRRNLLAGVCFALLYDEEQLQGFRLPWLSILRRMEELEHFEVLSQVTAHLPTQARLELGEWLNSKISPRLVELDQARAQAAAMVPYWHPDQAD